MKRLARSILALSLAFLIIGPAVTIACGPFTLSSVFTFTVHPAYPLANFAQGNFGVVQPSYARSYLVVAYRHLNRRGFNAQEQRMLTELWKERLDYGWQINYEDWIKDWLAARQKVSGVIAAPAIEVYRNREAPNQYETFLNCQKDAFDNATKTLNERIAKYGADAPTVKSWAAAQDQVFSNCGEGKQIPEADAGSADALVRADRQYQVAAANFYATDFDQATRGFDSIAKDDSSPWQVIAPYLAARSLVRKASLASEENKAEPLSQAEKRLLDILSNEKLAISHEPSSRLLNLVRLRLRPNERLHELAQKLTTTDNPSLKQDLWDYTVLLDRFLEANEADKAKFATDTRADDLTDWVVTIQSNSADALLHSLDKWRSTSSIAWLIVALSKLPGDNANAPEMIRAALKIAPQSPAFPSARFHAIRLLIESNKRAEARQLLDESLRNDLAQSDESTRNLFLSKRLQVAANLSEFLAAAPRIPAAVSWDDDGRQIPAEDSELSPETKSSRGKEFFDADATAAFNRYIPLSVLKEAVKRSSLPTHLRLDLAQATWLRAVLLNNFKTADELTPALKTLIPERAALFDRFATAQTPAAKRFAALFIWLKSPGLEPIVDLGLGRQTPLTAQDQYRDNWWCSAAYPPPTDSDEEEESLMSFAAEMKDAPAFLSEAETATAARENSTISSFGAAPNYIARQVIQFANAHPTDPRVPEALHLVVNSTRYGCTDANTGRWSKSAFDLLHRRYGSTPWAKKTRYWFKD